MFLYLPREFCILHHLQYCRRLKLHCQLWNRCLNLTKFWSKTGQLCFKKQMVLARSMFFFSTERSTFRPDRFWSKVHNMVLDLCQNGQQLLFPLSFPSFLLSILILVLLFFILFLLFLLFVFSQEHFGLKPFSFWEKPKGRRQKAKGWWRGWGRREEGGRRRARSWWPFQQ